LELGELFGRLATAASFASVCTLVQQYAATHGLTRVSFLDLQSTTSRVSEAVLCSNVPSRVLRRIDRVTNYADHPLLERARETHAPFAVSMAATLGLLGKNAHRPDAQPAANALVVPLRDDDGAVAMATLVGTKLALSPLAHDKLKLAVHAGWRRAQELRAGTSTAGTPSLTTRELECLTWVSRGKTDQEIARVLAVAPRTIRFHIDNAKSKLGVETRVQAVARLLRERPDLVKAL
jgi:DNA-binding CsgD family transcriptional regulator